MGCLTKAIIQSYKTIECSLFGCILAGLLILPFLSSLSITVTEEICRASGPLFRQWFTDQNKHPVVVQSRVKARSSVKVR